MRRWTVCAAALALALVFTLGAGAAWADEVVGKIQKMDQDQRTFVLEDGTELSVAEGVAIDSLTEGKKVKASYDEKDGKKVVTSIEVVAE